MTGGIKKRLDGLVEFTDWFDCLEPQRDGEVPGSSFPPLEL